MKQENTWHNIEQNGFATVEQIFEVSKSQDWYKNPAMLGHNWGKENLDALEKSYKKYSNTGLQKFIWEQTMNVGRVYLEDNWWYWCNVAGKSFKSRLVYILRRIDENKNSMVKVLQMFNNRSPMLKERLTHVLELLSYWNDKGNYFNYYKSPYLYLGASLEDVKERFKNYHEVILAKDNIPHFVVG